MTTPTVVAVYGSAGFDATSVAVPDLLTNDWLLATVGSSYSDATMGVTNGGDGAWVPIGSKVGRSNSPDYENYNMHAWYKVVEEPGTHTVSTFSTGDHTGLIVYHLRNAVAVDGVPTSVAGAQNPGASTLQDVPGVTTSVADALLIGVWGGVQFSGALAYTAPAGMSERREVSSSSYVALMSATQVLTVAGATGSRTGTGSPAAAYGWAAKLFAIRGGTYVPPAPEPEPEVAPNPPATPVLVTEEMGVDWSFVIGPRTGGLLRELTGATGRKINFKLGASSEASCTLDGNDPASAEIVELATDMHVFRSEGRGKPKRRMYRGRIAKTNDSLDANGHTVDVPSIDYRELLKRRLIMSGTLDADRNFVQKDQSLIAWTLLESQQSRTGGDLGITRGLGQSSGKLRDRAFNFGDSVGDKLQELSEVIEGFDWDITPTSDSAMQFDIWSPQRGVDRGEVLLYGGNIGSVTRSVDSSEYANAVRLTGKQSDGSGGVEPPPHEGVATDIVTRPEGRWDKLYAEDITTTAGMADRRDWRLADAQIIQPSYTVTLQSGWWSGPDHIWLGDTVRLVIMSGRLRVDTSVRVQEISVDIGDDGTEDVSMTLGYPRKNFTTKLKSIDSRLAKLERR